MTIPYVFLSAPKHDRRHPEADHDAICVCYIVCRPKDLSPVTHRPHRICTKGFCWFWYARGGAEKRAAAWKFDPRAAAVLFRWIGIGCYAPPDCAVKRAR